MALLLAPDHAQRALLEAKGVRCVSPSAAAGKALRVGIINLMPSAQHYEPLLLATLGASPRLVDPVFLRLTTHRYASSDAERLARSYVTYDEVAALDGLILTGAPVEELPFSEVRYFEELSRLLARSRNEVRSTLGLCWGGMLLAHLEGIAKTRVHPKLFGCFRMRALDTSAQNLAGEGDVQCIQSRHAGVADDDVERGARRGLITPLAHAPRTGYSVFESVDGRYVMHLGHPEYDRARILFEYQRDLDKGRSDVLAPEGISRSERAEELSTHGTLFFSRWLARVAGAASAEV